MNRWTGGVLAAAMTLLMACDDGRRERIPGAEPGAEALPAEPAWTDTLHPPVPAAPGDPGPEATTPAEPLPPPQP